MKYAHFVGFVLTVYLANWLIANVGECIPNGPCLIPVWWGVMAPSGVLAAGLAFTLRDMVHRELGRGWAIAAILLGAALSVALSPSLALASGGAFLVSESLDLMVYSRVARRSFVGAVLLSNTVGAVVDSLLFLTLAGFPLALVWGQVLGKMWVTLATVGILAIGRTEWSMGQVGER